MPQFSVQKIDVSKIYNGETKEIPFSFELVPTDTQSLDLFFPEPVNVSGRVYEKARGKNNAESYVELEFSIKGFFETHCARCSCDLKKDFCFDRVYGISKKLMNDSDEYIEVADGLLDIEELAESVFYLELPTKVLCKDDCKGMCPVCGCDLNYKECGCKKNIGANTLEELKKLLDK